MTLASTDRRIFRPWQLFAQVFAVVGVLVFQLLGLHPARAQTDQDIRVIAATVGAVNTARLFVPECPELEVQVTDDDILPEGRALVACTESAPGDSPFVFALTIVGSPSSPAGASIFTPKTSGIMASGASVAVDPPNSYEFGARTRVTEITNVRPGEARFDWQTHTAFREDRHRGSILKTFQGSGLVTTPAASGYASLEAKDSIFAEITDRRNLSDLRLASIST